MIIISKGIWKPSSHKITFSFSHSLKRFENGDIIDEKKDDYTSRNHSSFQFWYLPGTKRLDLMVPINTRLAEEVVLVLVLLVILDELIRLVLHSLFIFFPLVVESGRLLARMKSLRLAIVS